MAVKKTKKVVKGKPKKKKTGLIAVAILIIALISIIIYVFLPNKPSRAEGRKAMNSGNKAIVECIRNPAFPRKSGLQPPYAIDLKQDMYQKGMKIIEAKTGRVLKLPSWESFGYLGLYTLDNNGNIYTSPLPYISINHNPPEEQNRVLRVDDATGEMIEFLRLPSVNPPTSRNPYGVIGLSFDCKTNSLYATSVAGSSFEKETGKVFQIDPFSREISNTYDDFDALGIALFVGIDGKRAYLGSARKPEVYSVGIDDDGGFEKDLRFEFSLVDVPNGSYTKAHRILINDDVMTLKTREFSYTLIAASEQMKTVYKFKYNRNNGNWEFFELTEE